MRNIIAWLLGQQPDTCVDPRLAELDQLHDEAKVEGEQAKAGRVRAERIGSEQRYRLKQNHFGEGIKEALHQRGWTQT
jgi:hypothetical protein